MVRHWRLALVEAADLRRGRVAEFAALSLWRTTVGTRCWDGWRQYARRRGHTRLRYSRACRRSLRRGLSALRASVAVARQRGALASSTATMLRRLRLRQCMQALRSHVAARYLDSNSGVVSSEL